MKRKLKISRTVLGLICLFLALGITFGLAPFLQRVSAARVTIIRVASDIEEGSIIPESAIETVSVGGYNLPENIAVQKADVVGKYATADLQKGDFILNTKLSTLAPTSDTYLLDLPDGKQAISISVKSFAGGLSGKLLPGDIVMAIALDANKKAVMPMELHYLKVIAVTMTGGADKQPNGDLPKTKEGEVNATVTTVTLLVDEGQARRLAELEASNLTHISLVSRGDSDKADKLLETQEKVMKNTPEETIDVWNTANTEQPKESAIVDSMSPTVDN
jgi:pilus assembly protein CpaB